MNSNITTLGMRAVFAPEDAGAGGGQAGTAGAPGTGAATTGAAGAAGASGAGAGAGQNDGGQGGTPATFDDWHKALPKEHQELIAGHVTGLKTALDTERKTTQDFEKKLRDIAQVEDLAELQGKLGTLADEVKGEAQRADFFEAAHAVGVTNLRLAWTVAREDNLFKAGGSPDFDEIKKRYPELFKAATAASAAAGTGAGQGGGSGSDKTDMNALLRRSAGIGA